MNETYFDSQHSKYRDDTIFDYVSSEFLTLVEKDRKVSDEHLHAVVQRIVELMKQDDLFNLMFRKIMYGGSYYKDTKYGTPEEFDLNFIIDLPIDYGDIKIDTNHENYGFVKIKLNSRAVLDTQWKKYSEELDKLLTRDNYVDQKKFRNWIESVFKKTLSRYEIAHNGYIFFVNDNTYTIKYKKSGPAFTMTIQNQDDIDIDVDIVPCLEFGHMQLEDGFKPLNKELNKTWMVVAKPLTRDNLERNVLWRPCFYEYEKAFLDGAVKPVIQMVKKFRDTLGWQDLASYYIETLFYHELEKQCCNDKYLRASKTWLFMHALNELQIALEKQELPYYWHPKFNLFGKIEEKVLKRYAAQLKRKITRIESKFENDNWVLADVVLEKVEALAIRGEYKKSIQ
ncbi:cyclic GMP-AMP synthase isoform X3 [Nasonia vitripennis]|uniref:Cyclic GMP-AMP synthase n=1 Tax=Nasonia vitripennis TaxID=7425 RepID=A0A7M7H819_NASVI|nr:cyclic GMP-AMP synthase isoform X3 [Nasonia vitripennis]